MAAYTSNGVANDVQFVVALSELEPYLLKGVKRTADCKRLGTGSYGAVDELYVQGTLCAAKQLHESLLDPQNVHRPDKITSRFVEECRIMASVRHPNIVQFLGLHFFPNCSYPTLVMEKLAMSLDDLLSEAEKKKEELPLSMKVSILSDTAKGLTYLHNHKPQIIHRDLTSRNVLLTLAMQAKITDLGNALIIKSHTIAHSVALTQAPGTAVYMPPEAMQFHPKYNFAIDMFSYGHLALYTLIQEFPGDLLPPTFTTDGDPRSLQARSEIDRREKYMHSLHLRLGNNHQLTQIVTRCLSNVPSSRPCALDVLEELDKASELISDDIYRVFEHSSKLDLITMVSGDKNTIPRPTISRSTTCSSSETEERPDPDYLELINIPPLPNNTASATATAAVPSTTTLQRCEQIKTGMPGCLAISKVKSSTIRRKALPRAKKECIFMITSSGDSPSLVHFEVAEKPKVVKLADIVSVKSRSSLPGSSNFSFEIHLKGKDAPMEIIASSKNERDSWVEAVTQLTGQSSQKSHPPPPVPPPRPPSPWKQPEAASSKTRRVSEDVKMQPNVSFQKIPLNERKLPHVPVPSFTQPPVPLRDHRLVGTIMPTPSPLDDGYSRIRDFLPTKRRRSSLCLEYKMITQFYRSHDVTLRHSASDSHLLSPASTVKTLTAVPDPTQPRGALSTESDVSPNNSTGKKRAASMDPLDVYSPDDGYCDIRDFLHDSKCFYPRRRRRSSFCLEEEQSRAQQKSNLQQSASNSNLLDSSADQGAPTIISALKMLSRFDSSQMEHLIEMVTQTEDMTSHSNLNDSSSSVNCGAMTPPQNLRQISSNKSVPVLTKTSSADSEFRRRPTQLSLSLSMNETRFKQSQDTHSLQCNDTTATVNGDAGEKREVTAPSVVVESSESAPPKQRERSDVRLKAPESSNAMRFQLVRWLSETDGNSNTSLLVTEDNPTRSAKRPEWAKATTATTPVLTPMPIGDHLREKALFIERSALQDLEDIGEGQFGKVYKATLVQARSENITVAVKTISKYKSEQETSDFLHEMGVVMDLMHPNVVHIHGIVDQDSPWLVLQYLPNGDLKNYLINNERSIDQLIKYMIDVAMGMHYINEHGLVHRDLAARNVMVDNRETCKVADFGLLREIPKDDAIYQATTEMPWPIRWMAPESLDNREFSPATDVWSFGVLLWEMYYPSQLPYTELNNVQVLSRVLSGHRLPIPSNYPSTVARIMKACWQREPEKRPSFLLISQTLLTS